MNRSLARLLCRLGALALPPRDSGWAHAMRGELEQVADGDALAFGVGCLAAGVIARLRHDPSRATAARWALLLVALGFGVFHLGCTWTGFLAMRDTHPDLVLGRLRASASTPGAAAAYLTWRPVMVGLLGLLGLAQLVVAAQLGRGRRAAARTGWVAAATLSVALAVTIVAVARTAEGVGLLLVAVAVQGAALLAGPGPENSQES